MTRDWVKKNPQKKKEADKRYREKPGNAAKEKLRLKRYAEVHREKLLKYYRNYHVKNRHRAMLRWKADYEGNPEKFKERARKSYQANREKRIAASKKWAEANREKVRSRSRDWRKNNLERAREISLSWYQRNRVKRRAYVNKRLAEDSVFKMHATLSARFRLFLDGAKSATSVRDLVGCDYAFLWQYLERQFLPGMTRSNHGKVWHVDHFKPCAEFDPNLKEQREACWHFSNLQPLPVSENIAKGRKWSSRQEAEFKRRRVFGERAFAEYQAALVQKE